MSISGKKERRKVRCTTKYINDNEGNTKITTIQCDPQQDTKDTTINTRDYTHQSCRNILERNVRGKRI